MNISVQTVTNLLYCLSFEEIVRQIIYHGNYVFVKKQISIEHKLSREL